MAVGDCGPDNVSASNALMYLFKCCFDFWGDPPHGCNRDTLNALNMSSLRQFWSVMLISFNLPFGPQNDNGWANLLDEAVKHLATTYSHSNLPALFLQAAPRMLELLINMGVELPGLLDKEFELWDFFISQGLRRKGCEMMTNCRFQGSVASAQANVDYWEVDRTMRTQALLH